MSKNPIPVEVLEQVSRLLHLYGVANDAFDHGSVDEAAQLRQRATRGIRAALAEHPSLLELAPRLPEMLDRGLLTYSWPTVLEAMEQAIADRTSGGG
ncbi:MAG: hypothetical protein F9K18_00905 [Thermoanaerobaculia bacterium]|nr:MAG: hypothetical protein F9K18_00905 [Thermoanaerobaculia bacterium]